MDEHQVWNIYRKEFLPRYNDGEYFLALKILYDNENVIEMLDFEQVKTMKTYSLNELDSDVLELNSKMRGLINKLESGINVLKRM